MENKNFKNSTIMKIKINFQAKLLLITLLTVSLQLLTSNVFSQNVGISETGSVPDNSALLDLSSTKRGLLVPRMTTVERDAIVNPAHSLLIFNTTTRCIEFYDQDNNEWGSLGCMNPAYPSSGGVDYVHCSGTPTAVVDVTNPTTGKTWMDRNLGASQVATAKDDANSFGDLFQWGRFADGHQCRTSNTTTTLSDSDMPGHSDFIIRTASVAPNDWRSPQNDNFWQGVSGINNPCPSGYRLPTKAELEAERVSWGTNSPAGAMASPLKLPLPGFRNNATFNAGTITSAGAVGTYWSSTVNSINADRLYIYNAGAYTNSPTYRLQGSSVRCIKD
jgi:uncharacterized protein (TIGR02145 family)